MDVGCHDVRNRPMPRQSRPGQAQPVRRVHGYSVP
jgi:hypothetical protein